jgi:hypothetical protein
MTKEEMRPLLKNPEVIIFNMRKASVPKSAPWKIQESLNEDLGNGVGPGYRKGRSAQ